MIYTYTDRSYLRIGDEFSELGSNPAVQAKIFDPELHGELGGSLEPRRVESWGTHVCWPAISRSQNGKPGRFSTSKSLPGRVTWGKRDGRHDFLCALAALAALAIKYGRREIIMVSSYPGFITIKVRWSFTNSNEDMNLSKTWVNLDKMLVIYSWVAFGFPLSDTNNQQLKIKLAGGLELFFYFSHHIGNSNPSWRTHIFQRGRLNHQPGKFVSRGFKLHQGNGGLSGTLKDTKIVVGSLRLMFQRILRWRSCATVRVFVHYKSL